MDDDNLLIDAAERIFADLCDKALLDAAETGEFPGALWATLKENGFHELAMADSGISLGQAFSVMRVAGRYALPLPLAEILLANRWLGRSDGFATVGRVLGARVVDVPWGRRADRVIALQDDGASLVEAGTPGSLPELTEDHNLAGEPRDSLALPAGAAALGLDEPAYLMLALARAVSMAGALERILELCLGYANERQQFGRPIGKFQAVQQQLALAAGEVAAASRAADAGIDAIDDPRFEAEVAIAKARVGEAVGVVAEIAHQVHGAMGFTHEHQLHHFTRRAWAWRDEYGSESQWQRNLGEHLAALGAGRVWSFIATRG